MCIEYSKIPQNSTQSQIKLECKKKTEKFEEKIKWKEIERQKKEEDL